MPRLAINREDKPKHKQERDKRYLSRPEVIARKRDRDRLYRARKRQEERLEEGGIVIDNSGILALPYGIFGVESDTEK